MPVNDWTRVDAGIFHAFHTAWIPEIQAALNDGLLPDGYYALAEQHAGNVIADVLTLHTSESPQERPLPPLPDAGRVAVAEAPPRTRRKHVVELAELRRSLAIRQVSGHRLVALVEIVSPGNKDRVRSVADFTDKVESALTAGVHVLLADLFPPGPHDPAGMHGAIIQRLEDSSDAYDLPAEEPLTLAGYSTGRPVEIYLEHLAVGGLLVDMPLFLTPDRYISVPLQATYNAAFRGMPAFWRDVLERNGNSNG
ncbi:MAG: DUF4058 family protein [Planctomycetota bacterium]|nr:DUF4058 family protein [Planctomycetota bacterium]